MAATEVGLARYPRDRFLAYLDSVVEETRQLPGVESVSVSNSMPLHLDQSSTTVFALPITDPATVRGATTYSISPGFFANLQIPLLSGRDITPFDDANAPHVGIINTELAARLFAGANAVGRQVRVGGLAVTIVGITDTGKYVSLGESPRGALFRPLKQNYSTSSMLIARTREGSGVTPQDLRRVIQRIDPDLPIRTTATGGQLTAMPLLPYRAGVIALGLLGLIASGLLLSGLHAMLAYAVVRRSREIGIRVALGANRSTVIRTVVTRVATILGIGGAVGALMSAGTGPLISSVVLGVSPRDPVLLAAIVALLGLIALVSCAGPIRRSLNVDPVVALRIE
jgi:hypothetical protein